MPSWPCSSLLRLRRVSRLAILFVAVLAPLLLTGCVEKVDRGTMQRQASIPAGDLYADHTIGQTFVSRRDGLNAIEVLLADYEESDRSVASLELVLLEGLLERREVARTTIPAETIVHNLSFRFQFARQCDSAGRSYLLQVSAPQASTPARATLWAHSADLYAEGTLLNDDQPVPGDLTFWCYYDMQGGTLTSEVFRQAWGGLGHLPSLVLLLLAPGYLLARCLPRSRDEDGFDLLGMCLSLSVAVVPVALLLVSQTRLELNGWIIRVCGGLLGVVTAALLARDLFQGRWRKPRGTTAALGIGLTLVVGIGLFLRALHALDLTGPLWVDAVHHTLLGRLIIERGGIPGDYFPYVEVSPGTYHFGFHSLVAAQHWLTGEPLSALPGTLLQLGQALSGLAGLPLYVLGKRWGKSRWAGLAAAVVPSALSLLPAYYVSWSRYPQLTGLVILPVAIVLFEKLLRMQRWHWGLAGATAVALAGLIVTNLRVAAFLAVYVAISLLGTTLRRRYDGRAMGIPWVRVLAVGLAAVVLTSPWLLPSIWHLGFPEAEQWPTAQDTLSFGFVRYGPGRYVVPVALVGIALGLLWRNRRALLLLFWTGLLVLMANPHLLGLNPGGPLGRWIPGLSGTRFGPLVDDLSVGISLYVPVSLGVALGCGVLANLARRLNWQARSWIRWAGAALVVGLSLWGVDNLKNVVSRDTALLTEADLEAMAWIEDRTPEDALFLINGYAWLPEIYAGSDGGYWITPLTGRRTWPPPALYGLGTESYVLQVNEVVQEAMEQREGEDLYDLLKGYGFTHVYLGPYGGPLTPETFDSRPHFQPAYRENGVWIFALKP